MGDHDLVTSRNSLVGADRRPLVAAPLVRRRFPLREDRRAPEMGSLLGKSREDLGTPPGDSKTNLVNSLLSTKEFVAIARNRDIGEETRNATW